MSNHNAVEVNGPALRAMRTLAGLNITEMSKRVGIDRSHLTNLELGHRRRVSPGVFNALISALGIEDRRAIMANPYGASGDSQAVA